MLAVEAFRRIAQARRRTKLPITFLFTPDEELSSPVSRRVIEREARGQRYVLVTEPARDGGKVVTERKGIGVFVIRTRGRPAHAGGDPNKGRNAPTPERLSIAPSEAPDSRPAEAVIPLVH
jgi:glutamate carboxypeptidase